MSETAAAEELLSDLKSYAEKVKPLIEHCDTEEQTKISFINPLIEVLGHDVRDPRQVRFEYTVDVRLNKEKADYAILHDGEPVILIEAKTLNTPINNPRFLFQVRSYANQLPSVRFVALTNGIEWHWFKKASSAPNQYTLEERPFLKHNVTKPSQQELHFLSTISGRSINFDQAETQARESSLLTSIDEWLASQLDDDAIDQNLMKLLTQQFVGLATVKNIELTQRVWLIAFKRFIARHIEDRFNRAQESEKESGDAGHSVSQVQDSFSSEAVETTRDVSVEPKEFDTLEGKVVLDKTDLRRAWRRKDSPYWEIEKNGSSLMTAVIDYFGNTHNGGVANYLSIISIHFPSLVSNNPSIYNSFRVQAGLPLGYYLNTNLRNSKKEERLKQFATYVEVPGQRIEASDLVEWWM